MKGKKDSLAYTFIDGDCRLHILRKKDIDFCDKYKKLLTDRDLDYIIKDKLTPISYKSYKQEVSSEEYAIVMKKVDLISKKRMDLISETLQ